MSLLFEKYMNGWDPSVTYNAGDIVIWSKRHSYRTSHQVCRIQKINTCTYAVIAPINKNGVIEKKKSVVMKENILRAANEDEVNEFFQRMTS